MKPTVSVAVSLTFAVIAVESMWPSPGTARADVDDPFFASPSTNIECHLAAADETAFAACEIRDHTWATPPRPTPCMGSFGNRISIRQGGPPEMTCHTDSLMGNGYPTLPYGQKRSLGSIACDSEISGMTCTDTGTGHYFLLARDNYELH